MAKKRSSSSKPAKAEAHDPRYSGPSDAPLQPTTFDPDLVSLAPSDVLINSDVTKPKWKKNKYPVSKSEYEKLIQSAAKPDATSRMALAAADVAPDADDETDGVTFVDDPATDLPEDVLLQSGAMTLAPATSGKFQAIPATGWIPPDCVVATGPQHVVVAVNSEYRVYTKSGTQQKRQLLSTFFSNVLPNSTQVKVFDPRIIYDHYNQRYVMIAAATQESPAKSWLLIGVTKTNSAMGSWWVWATDSAKNGSTSTTNWGDYPMLGFDSEGVYVTFNMFKGDTFQYGKLRIFNNDELYNGKPLKYYDFWNLKNSDGSLAFTVQPCEHYRGKGSGPVYLINNHWGSGSKLQMWTLTNPLAYWSGGTPSLGKDSISCKSYNLPPMAQQKGSSTTVNTNDNRLLSAVYQHADSVRRIWTTHNTKITWTGETAARSGIQWYEVDVPSKKVIQQNAYGAKGKYYFFPALQVDLRRNAYIVFSRSASDMYPEMRITGRKASGALNDLENSALVKQGESAHTSGRYGDYFGIGRDGSDPNRVFGVGEYAESSGQWGTYVVSAKY